MKLDHLDISINQNLRTKTKNAPPNITLNNRFIENELYVGLLSKNKGDWYRAIQETKANTNVIKNGYRQYVSLYFVKFLINIAPDYYFTLGL